MSANFEPIQNEYKNLTPFKNWLLLQINTWGMTNFPFVESDFDELTNYGMMQKLMNAVNDVISNENEVEQDMTNLFKAFTELQSYVNDYFDNLDVQDEINNKLDQMAEDGTITNLIKQYIDPIQSAFENDIQEQINVIDTKVTNIASGSPLVATSVSGMTETDRVYVNLTDGKWYYYDGDSWEIGGTYQATQIGDGEIQYYMLSNELKTGITPINGTILEPTQTGSYYIDNGNGVISSVANASFVCGVNNVNSTDIICQNFTNPYPSYGLIKCLIFTDNNGNIIKQYSKDELCQTIGGVLLPKNNTISVPYGATKLYWNVNINTDSGKYGTRGYPVIVTEMNYYDKRINDLLINPKALELDDTIVGKIYGVKIADYSLVSYSTYVFNVKPLEKINIKSTLAPTNYISLCLFADDDLNIVGYSLPMGTTNVATSTDIDVVVPPFATKVLICQRNSDPIPNVYKYYLSDTNETYYKNINVDYSSDGILTLTNNDNGNYVKFRNFGGNSLFMISDYKVGTNVKTLYTDMTPAPYIVNAINNPTGDRTTEGFTGGNHQWNNQGSGSTPTATQVSLNVYADDILLNRGSNVNCNKIKIIEVNNVQANNTCLENGGGRNVLEETIVFNFDGTKLDLINTIKALEDINISKYYGIQLSSFSDNLYNVYSDKVYTNTNLNLVTKKPDMIFGNNILKGEMDSVGLGDYRYNTSGNKCLISNNKAYYVPIYGTCNLSTNEKVYIKGSYTFDDKQI